MTILLRNLISEVGNTGPEQRVTMLKVASILEKVLPELTKSQASKLEEMFEEINEVASEFNTSQYTRTDNDLTAWSARVSAAKESVERMIEAIEKISESKKEVDFRPLVLALGEVMIN